MAIDINTLGLILKLAQASKTNETPKQEPKVPVLDALVAQLVKPEKEEEKAAPSDSSELTQALALLGKLGALKQEDAKPKEPDLASLLSQLKPKEEVKPKEESSLADLLVKALGGASAEKSVETTQTKAVGLAMPPMTTGGQKALKLEDLAAMSPAQVNEHWDGLKSILDATPHEEVTNPAVYMNGSSS